MNRMSSSEDIAEPATISLEWASFYSTCFFVLASFYSFAALVCLVWHRWRASHCQSGIKHSYIFLKTVKLGKAEWPHDQCNTSRCGISCLGDFLCPLYCFYLKILQNSHLSSYFSRLNFSEVSYVVLSAAEFLKSYRSISEHNTYFILLTSHSVIMKLSFITHNAEQPESPSVTFCIVCVFSYLCMMSGCGLFHYFHFRVMDIPK